MEADRASSANRCARCRTGGRSARHQRDRARVENRLPLVRLPARVWSSNDDLQSVCSLGTARDLGKPLPGVGQSWTFRRHTDDRLYTRESPPLSGRRKRGAEKQALGRSRGGRNTKIHALADAKGRLIAILLTGGEAHDCPVAERLIRRVERPKRILGDKAYDSAELREELTEHGTKPVIPNRSNRKQPFSFNKRLYKLRWRIEAAFNRIKDFRRIATRYDKLARNYLASVCLAAALAWWI